MKKLLIINEDITQFDNVKLFLNRANACSFAVKYAGFSLPIAEKMSVLRQMHRHSKQTKFVVLSRHVWMDFVQGITEGCADAFLELPVLESDFFACLNKLIF